MEPIAIPLVQTTDRNVNQLQQNIISAFKRLTSRSSSAIVSTKYDIVVSGTDSLQDAINSLNNGGAILVLSTYSLSENIIVNNNNILIEGVGNISIIRGTLSVNSSHFSIDGIRVNGDVTFNSASSYCYFQHFWVPSTVVVTDNGTSNYIVGIRE